MTEHLPECWAKNGSDPEAWCICDELRACEERVTERWESLRGLGESYAYKTGSDVGFDAGLNAGLDAAREAVAALPWQVAVSFGPIDCDQSCEHGPCSCSGVMRPEAWMTGPAEALAAIAALKGER